MLSSFHRKWFMFLAKSAVLSASLVSAFQSNSFISTTNAIAHIPPTYTHLASSTNNQQDDIPTIIQSPVLLKLYPAILVYKQTYGHPNIPLGSEDGKRCKTVRRLGFQNKLNPDEVNLLTQLGFRWNSFEDTYTECDFDEMRAKLIDYKKQTGTYQIPKKYNRDPELGAWVTMLRRLYRTGDLPVKEVDMMNEIKFEWTSTRKCGSSFMMRYREVAERLQDASSKNQVFQILEEDDQLRKWLYAQKCAFENGKLSDSRVQYMDDLCVDWRNVSF